MSAGGGGPPALPARTIKPPVPDVSDDHPIPLGLGTVGAARDALEPIMEMISVHSSVAATADAILGLIFTKAFGDVSVEDAVNKIENTVRFVLTKGARQRGEGIFVDMDEEWVLKTLNHYAKVFSYMMKKVSENPELKQKISDRPPLEISPPDDDEEWDVMQIGSGLPRGGDSTYGQGFDQMRPMEIVKMPAGEPVRSPGGFIPDDYFYMVPHTSLNGYICMIWNKMEGPRPKGAIEGATTGPVCWASMLCESLSAIIMINDPYADLAALRKENLSVGQLAARLQDIIRKTNAVNLKEPSLALTGYFCTHPTEGEAREAMKSLGSSIDSPWMLWPEEVAPSFTAPTDQTIRNHVGGLFVGDKWFYRNSPKASKKAGSQINKDFGRYVPHRKTIFYVAENGDNEGLDEITGVILKYVRLNQKNLVCNPDTGDFQFGPSRPLILASSSYSFWTGKDFLYCPLLTSPGGIVSRTLCRISPRWWQ